MRPRVDYITRPGFPDAPRPPLVHEHSSELSIEQPNVRHAHRHVHGGREHAHFHTHPLRRDEDAVS